MTTTLTLPQLGEGLREAVLVRVLIPVGGDAVTDAPLYEVETEKAVVQVEASVSGKVLRWRANEGDTVAVYAPIVDIETADADAPEKTVAPHALVDTQTPVAPPARISPRARAFARAKGVSEDDLASLPAASGVLNEDDIERWIAGKQGTVTQATDLVGEADYTDEPLSPRQQVFNQRAFGAVAAPVAATIKLPIPWDAVTAARDKLQAQHPEQLVTEFHVLAHAAARAAIEHPKLRTRLRSGMVTRRYNHIDIGFAIRLSNDDLTTAVVERADTLSFGQVAAAVTTAMRNALRGTEDQANERTTLLLTYMAAHGITDAQPVLTAPAVAVLFIGAPQLTPEGEKALLVLTFDHRLMNGVGAAGYLHSLRAFVEAL